MQLHISERTTATGPDRFIFLSAAFQKCVNDERLFREEIELRIAAAAEHRPERNRVRAFLSFRYWFVVQRRVVCCWSIPVKYEHNAATF